MQVFYNIVLGKVWFVVIDYVFEEQLFVWVENFGICWSFEKLRWCEDIFVDVVYIIVGVDVQLDCFEISFIGYSQRY